MWQELKTEPCISITLGDSEWQTVCRALDRFVVFEEQRLETINDELSGLVYTSIFGELQRVRKVSAKILCNRQRQKRIKQTKKEQLLLA